MSTVEETFSNISGHMVKGLMIHDQMSNYFNFLGLPGFQREQEYHFYEEVVAYRKLIRYYLDHYNKLPVEPQFDNPAVIPSNWYKYARQDVDTSTKRNSIRDGFTKWIDWEKETKSLYEKAASDLYMDGSVAGSIVVEKLVQDVDQELARAEEEMLLLESMGYDLVQLSDMQDRIEKKYEKKLKEIKL